MTRPRPRTPVLVGAVAVLGAGLAACSGPDGGSSPAGAPGPSATAGPSAGADDPGPTAAPPQPSQVTPDPGAAAPGAAPTTPTTPADGGPAGGGPAAGDAPGPAPSPEGGGPAGAGDPVDVVLTFGAWDPATSEVQVGAYVADVIEEGGVCTLQLVQGDRAVTARADGAADATVTGCGPLAVGGSALSPGRWTGTVHYASSTSAGQSTPVEIEVP